MPKITEILKSRDRSALRNTESIRSLRGEDDSPKNFGRDIVARSGTGSDKTAEVYLYDVIGWPFIEAVDVVTAIPDGVENINLHINSPGGDVFEGLSIYNWLREHSARVSVQVDGLAASVASVIAMAGSNVSMPKSSFMMIHDPWTIMLGNAEDLRKEADLLEQIESVLAEIYAAKSGQEVTQVRQWMHDESWFTGQEARERGFADAVIDGAAAANTFNLSAFGQDLKNTNNNTEDFTMNEELRKLLEAQGLDSTATDEQAQKFMQDLLAAGKLDPVDHKEIQDAAVKAERHRAKEIRKACKTGNLSDEFTDSLIDEGLPLDAAREKIFAEMEKKNPPMGPGRIESGETEMQKFKGAAVDGLLMRAGEKLDKPAPGAEQLRGHELTSLVRESLARSGVNVSALTSRVAIADYIFRSRQGSMTTSDFPEVFRDAADKVLQRRYREAPGTWRAWCNLTTTSDFKNKYVVALSEGPDLKKVGEADEYTYGTFLEKGESYAPNKYGRIIKLTWEMLVNDDLGAFVREAAFIGNAAARLESKLVYDHLLSGANNHGPTLAATNRQLFNGTDGNLLQTGRAITASNLDEARQKMRGQKSLQGNYLDIEPRFLLVSPKNEMVTDVLLTSAGHVGDVTGDDASHSGVTNPMRGRFQSIVEPRLLDVFSSGLGWYLIADPAQIDTLECAHLSGFAGPDITEREGFETDSIEWKIRHVFGVGAIEHRSMVLNDGTA